MAYTVLIFKICATRLSIWIQWDVQWRIQWALRWVVRIERGSTFNLGNGILRITFCAKKENAKNVASSGIGSNYYHVGYRIRAVRNSAIPKFTTRLGSRYQLVKSKMQNKTTKQKQASKYV